MGNTANPLHSPSWIGNEIKYLRQIEAIKKIAVSSIDKIIDEIGFIEFDYDCDNQPFVYETAEFEYLGLGFWVDLEIKNDSCLISAIDVKDDLGNDYPYVSQWLNEDLNKYYDNESKLTCASYNQSIEIAHDQSDPYNVKPKMPLGYDINPQYIKAITSICQDNEAKVLMFLRTGYGGKLKLKKRIRPAKLVKMIMPIINDGIFIQANRHSDKKVIAGFIQDNFTTVNGSFISLKTISNNVSKYFSAS